MSAEALAPDHCARHRLPAGGGAVVVDGEEQVPEEQKGRLLWRVLLGLPHHLQLCGVRSGSLGVEHLAGFAWPDHQHSAAPESRRHKYQAMACQRPRRSE